MIIAVNLISLKIICILTLYAMIAYKCFDTQNFIHSRNQTELLHPFIAKTVGKRIYRWLRQLGRDVLLVRD